MTRLKKFSFFAVVLSVCLSFFFTACEGFFTDNDLDEKIKAAVDYAHMPYSTCQISADSGTGSITPLGSKQYKPTDFMNIEFVMEPAYEFINWEFIYKETITKEGEIQKEASDPEWWKDYVKIVKQSSSEKDGKTTFYLQVQFTKGTDNLIIKPKCSKKPLVDAWEPGDSNAGVPRETQIRIKFDSELKESSFFYTAEELAQLDTDGIPPENLLKEVYNEVEKVYGYKTSYGAVFKSIKITVDGGDYTSYFVGPVLETIDAGNKKYTRVSFTPQDALPCPDDESKTAAVTVDLYNTIQNKDGASLTPTRYSYRINSKPLEYSYVDMSDYNIEEGQPNPGNARFEFAISKHIPLSYKENPSYKFLYWTTNNSNIRFADGDPTLNPTSFYSTVLIKESDKAKIKPVTVVRPKFQEADFKASYAGTNPRDTDIILTFDKDIVIPEGTKIAITCTGKGDVSTSFEAPEIVTGNNKKIQILAKQDENRIQVRSGEKLTITVTIPNTLYYVYHDALTNQDINVSLGKEIVAEYKIDETTQDKASVSFSAQLNGEACGTINVDNVKKTDDTAIPYNIDYEAIINFKPNENYEFLYWTASNDKIEIKDRFSASTTIIAKKSGSCTITAKCAPKLKVLSLRPNASDNKNPCDSDIWIETNIKPLDLTATGRTSDNKKCNSVLSLSVNYNGTDVMSSHYESPQIKEEGGKFYIYLKSKKKLTVPQDTVNTVNVKIDGAFHYAYVDSDGILTDPVEINLVNGNYSASFGVVEKTQKQIYVKLAVDPNHMTLATAPLDPYKNNSGVYVLNENTEYDLNFTAKDAYQFVKWNITEQGNNDADDAPVRIQKTTQFGIDYYKLIVGKAKEGVGTGNTNSIIIGDDSAERIKPVFTWPENDPNGVYRDSGIVLTFNKKPDESIKQKIQISVDGYSANNSFKLNDAVFGVDSENKPTLTIEADLDNRISVGSGAKRKVKVLIPADVYYLREGETEPQITLGSAYEYEYIINEQTNNKVIVDYQIQYWDNDDSTPDTVSAGTIKCDDKAVTVNSSNTNDRITYYQDAVVHTLTFTEKPGYQFLYWETSAPASIVFDSSTPKTSKTIQFTTNEPNLNVTLKAYCAPRLEVTSFTPVNQSNGVPRDSEINIAFNYTPDNDIKNKIRISCDGNSANSNFLLSSATFTGTTLKIKADSTRKISVPENAKRTVTVSIPEDVSYSYVAPDAESYNISLGKEVLKEYTITEETSEKASVTYQVVVINPVLDSSTNTYSSTITSNNASAGTIRCDNKEISSKVYNMDSTTRTLTFTESSDYQFLYWDIPNSSIININDTTTAQTTFVPAGNGEVTVKAVCAPRLKLASTGNIPADAPGGVACDSNIQLTFNYMPLLTDCTSDITIYADGSSVIDSFPVANWAWAATSTTGSYKLSVPASTSNRISFQSGLKKTVTITVPSTLYYSCTIPNHGTYDITCGDNSLHQYTINSSTRQSASITFKVYEGSNVNEDAGTIIVDDVVTTSIDCSMDNIIRKLQFEESPDYQFLYWESTDNNVIQIPDNKKESMTSSFIPIGTGDTTSAITIKAVCAPRIRVTAFTPGNTDDGVEQDSDIKITFNKKPVNYTAINVYRNNNLDTTRFQSRDEASNIVTIATTKITAKSERFVTGGTTEIKVEIPSTLYYTYTAPIGAPRSTYLVKYGGSGVDKYYTVNSSTCNKVVVKPASSITGGTMSLSPSRSDNKYSIGESIEAVVVPGDGYQFTKWTVSGTSGVVTVSGSDKTSATLTVEKDDSGTFTVTPSVYQRPTVSAKTPYSSDPTSTFSKNTPITITFATAIDQATKDKILVSYTGISNFDKTTYYTTEISPDYKTVTLTPKKMLPVENDFETVTVTVPHNDIYYTLSGTSTRIRLDDNNDYVWSYRVDKTTTTNTKVRVYISNAVSGATNLKVNDQIQTSGTDNIMNVEDSLNLEYPVSDGYKFTGWKIASQNTSYTVSYSNSTAVDSYGYVKKGIIYVKNGSTTYFTLTINSTDPTKAVLTSVESITGSPYALAVYATDDLVPKVSTVTPSDSDSGVACDTNITIKFNKAVNKSTVTFGRTGSIQIIDNDSEHYENYFNTPTWNDSTYTLTIKPKYTIYDLLPNSTDTKNLMVKINSNSIKDSDGTSLGNDASWTYKINYNKETVPPSVSTLKLYKHEYSTTGVEQDGYTELSSIVYSSFNSTQYTSNHINNKIYIDSTITDSGSGFKMVSIKETLVQTIDGTNTELDVTPAVPKNFSSTQLTKKEYVLNSVYDGIIKLDFIFEDYAGNTTTKTFYVIKDTSLDSGKSIKPKFDFSTTTYGYYWSVVNETVKGSDQNVISPSVTNFTYYKKMCDASKTNITKLTPNSSGNLTFTFDFSSCKDTFAKNNETAVNYELKWGYASNSMPNSATKVNDTKFQITYTATKDCYVQITACDKVGNKKTLTRVIPRQVSIMDLAAVETTYKRIKPSDMDTLENIGKQYNAQVVNFLYYFKYKASSTASYSDIYNNFTGTDVIRWGSCGRAQETGGMDLNDDYIAYNKNFYLSNPNYTKLTDAILTPNGIYEIYIIPYIVYPEGTYYGATSTVPYKLYHNVTPPSSSTEPTFGNYSYTLSEESNTQYSGVRNVKVTTNFTKTSGYTYGMAYKKYASWSDTQATLSSFDFNIPSGYEYQILLYARNNNTGTVYYEPTSTRKTLDVTYDNAPPYIDFTENFLWTGTNQIYFTSECRPMDDSGFGVGFKDTTDGYKTFDYYILPKQDSTTTAHDVITKADLTGKTKRTAKFLNANRMNIQIDFDVFVDGYYLLVLDLVDKNNNEALYTYTISNYTYPQITKVSYSTSTDKVVFGVYENPGNTIYNFNAGMGFYLAPNGDWRLTSQDAQLPSISETFEGSNTFYKVTRRSSAKVRTYTYYNFVSTEYWVKRIKEGKFPTCASKSMLPGYSNTYQVFFDAPCFAHTMACPKELVSAYAEKANEILTKCTDISYEQALASVWATKGQEFGCQLLNGDKFQNMSATYTCPVSKIPSDYAYMIIAHFADGSVVMSDIKIKE